MTRTVIAFALVLVAFAAPTFSQENSKVENSEFLGSFVAGGEVTGILWIHVSGDVLVTLGGVDFFLPNLSEFELEVGDCAEVRGFAYISNSKILRIALANGVSKVECACSAK